jgi:hypothetical protein
MNYLCSSAVTSANDAGGLGWARGVGAGAVAWKRIRGWAGAPIQDAQIGSSCGRQFGVWAVWRCAVDLC